MAFFAASRSDRTPDAVIEDEIPRYQFGVRLDVALIDLLFRATRQEIPSILVLGESGGGRSRQGAQRGSKDVKAPYVRRPG